jgi:nitrite reductase/ring-hydroxylating ferredoxin subunit
MSVAFDWREDDDAPAQGAVVGLAARFDKDGAYFVDIGDFAMILVRRGAALSAFWNLCPHQFLPLNWRGDSVLSADGALIRCSNHDAAFHAGDGTPAGGGSPVACGLSQIPVRVEDGNVVIGPA